MPANRTTPEQFWDMMDRRGPDACWLWECCVGKHGYGVVGFENKRWRAHCLAFTLAYGPIPAGALVCHDCPDGDNPLCCNPDHLWLGSPASNMEDKIRKGRARYVAPRSGEAHHSAKLTEDDVRGIRARYAAGGIMYRELAEEYGVHRVVIGQIVRGQIWKHVEGIRPPLPRNIGERNPRVRVTEAQVREIRARYAAGGTSLPRLAREFGIGTSTVFGIVSRQSWKHLD